MNLFDRLFSKAIIREDGCWEFCGGCTSTGYGMIRANGRKVLAHRVAYDLVVDDIPFGMQVLHSCDNPSCVNPSHLFLGTIQDNSKDKVAKGRQDSKLNPDMIRGIRADLASNFLEQQEIATKYGVSRPTITDIKNGKTWSHVK